MSKENLDERYKIAILGLGYVGLPLAIEFSKKYSSIGYDINKDRIKLLKENKDYTNEVSEQELAESYLDLTYDINDITDCNIFIITVPTPVDEDKKPLLSPLVNASKMIGKILKKNDVVIYESTVYPGCTEEICVPILEEVSGYVFNEDFYCGYSPERINPGDKVHRLTKIKKIVSGSNEETLNLIDRLYSSIIDKGTYKASCIKVAEAAKVIENSQRDINIAFINELSKIFNKLDLDTLEVLEAASTKWNFLPFKPGLVGGHCIGVDPYYLAQKAQEVGYNPEIILSGRSVNDSMGKYIANEVLELMNQKNIPINKSNILILGITFKENCPDIRNSKVVDIYNTLNKSNINIDVYDPLADIIEVKKAFNINLIKGVESKAYDCIILAVAHQEFLGIDLKRISNKNTVIYDVKGILDKKLVTKRL